MARPPNEVTKVRKTLRFPLGVWDRVEALQEALGCDSRSEALRNIYKLWGHYRVEAAQGWKLASSDGKTRTDIGLEEPDLGEERKRYNLDLYPGINATLEKEASHTEVSEMEVLCGAIILADAIATELQQGRDVGYRKGEQYRSVTYDLFIPLVLS